MQSSITYSHVRCKRSALKTVMVILYTIFMYCLFSRSFPNLFHSSTTRKSQRPVLEPTKTVAVALTVVPRTAAVLAEAVAMIRGMDLLPQPARVECPTLPCAH